MTGNFVTCALYRQRRCNGFFLICSDLTSGSGIVTEMFDFQGKFIITLLYYFNANPQLKVSLMFGLSRGTIVIEGRRGKIFIRICLLLAIAIFELSHSISTFKRLWTYI